MDHALPPEPQITVADLDALITQYFDTLQKDKVIAEEQLTAVNKNIAQIEGKLVTHLKALGRKEYKHARGTVGISNTWRVNGPQTDADKAALFAWMKEQGIYEKYAGVNVQALNALWKAEREAAIKADPDAAITFALPGVGPAKLFEKLTKRKGNEESDE